MWTKRLNLKIPSGNLEGVLPRWYGGKESTANIGDTRDTGPILGLGISPTLGNGNQVQYSHLENFTEKPGGLQSMGWQRVGHD